MRQPGVMVLYFLHQVISRKFDPFAPVWLFLVGVSANVRDPGTQAFTTGPSKYAAKTWSSRPTSGLSGRCFGFCWSTSLAPHESSPGYCRVPPVRWSAVLPAVLCPPLIIWGLFCANMFVRGEVPVLESLLERGGALSIVSIRDAGGRRDARRSRVEPGKRYVLVYLALGLLAGAAYVAIWMFNGKRSHSLIGLLATVCALYLTRLKRPSWPVLITTGVLGALVVTIALGWREAATYPRSVAGFTQYPHRFSAREDSRQLEHQG